MKHAKREPNEGPTGTNLRYVTTITERYRWLYQIQMTTFHKIGNKTVETPLDRPPVRFSLPWARLKAKRMRINAHKKDVRERQPWAVSE